MSPIVSDYYQALERERKDGIDCQAAKFSKDLEEASQNQGAIQDGAHELEPSSIMEKYRKTGELPQMIQRDPTYGDFSEPLDYQRAFAIVQRAEEQFHGLDSHIRNRFENDPAQFLSFCQDPANQGEMRKMGLMKPLPEPPSQVQANVVPPSQPAPKGDPGTGAP